MLSGISLDGTVCFSRMAPSRAEAPDQAAKLEAMQKKLLLEMKAAQANQLKTLRADMSKETKRIETATQAQVCTAYSCAAVFRHCWTSCSQRTILLQTCPSRARREVPCP